MTGFNSNLTQGRNALAKRGILAALAVGGLLSAGAAYAQSVGLTPGITDEVTITAPRHVGRDAQGGIAGIDYVNMSARVSYADLNLQTEGGSAELDRRITEAAQNICRQIELNYPVGSPDAVECTNAAVQDAERQVR